MGRGDLHNKSVDGRPRGGDVGEDEGGSGGSYALRSHEVGVKYDAVHSATVTDTQRMKGKGRGCLGEKGGGRGR